MKNSRGNKRKDAGSRIRKEESDAGKKAEEVEHKKVAQVMFLAQQSIRNDERSWKFKLQNWSY